MSTRPAELYSDGDIATLTSQKIETNCHCVIKDHLFDDMIESLHEDVQSLREHLRPAKMSKSQGEGEWEDENHRGDSICWVTPQLCRDLNLSSLQSFIVKMLQGCGALRDELGLTMDYSCQFAVYPGKGEGYNRHKDAFSASPSRYEDGQTTAREPSRQLTCLLYLNKDWVPEDGGRLRVFTHPGVHVEKGDEAFSFWGVNGYDIDPLFGRMIVFRSELVEHAVLPCFKERIALTLWLKGEGPAGVSTPEASVFKFDADAPQPTIRERSDSDSSDSESSESDNDNNRVEVVHGVNDCVEVKVNGLWVDGVVTAVANMRYDVTTPDGHTATNKGRYEVRQPGPKHMGTLQSRTGEQYEWVTFRAKWRDMSPEERGATDSVVFGEQRWTCCGGAWNSPPCGRQ
mmetsp:Transcript_14433/g.23900  ORF Transcript_14433/g.23900 Transcript_14433/m.23900 type:complete len:401 (+) Transcript_14433:71-1273(+)